MSSQILIAGATGRIGRVVVKQLLQKGIQPRVLVRDMSRAMQLFPKEVECIQGDLADMTSLKLAIRDVDAALLLSPVHPQQCTLQNNLVQAAKDESEVYLVKISGLGTSADSYIDSGRWHAETEQHIVESGLPYTFLRPLFFMQNLAFQLQNARKTGIISSAVQERGINMVDVNDIAGVVSELLVRRSGFVGQALPLTGAVSYTYQDVAGLLTKLWGDEIRFRPQSYEELEINLKKSGQPDWHINIVMQFNRAFNEGWGDIQSDTIEKILMRSPGSLENYLIGSPGITNDNNPFPS